MPMTRITLRQGYSDAALGQISDVLHQTLVDEFAVPAADRFQIIEMLPDVQRSFDRHYLSGTRSADFMLFHIVAGKLRTSEQKQNFYRVLSERLHVLLGINPDDVMVVIQFNTAQEWSFSRGDMYQPVG
ncbi:tautomerase family protein [Ewingella americana]